MTNFLKKMTIGAAVVGGLVAAGFLAAPAMASGLMSAGNHGAMMQSMGSMMKDGHMGAMMQNMGNMMKDGHMGGMMQNMGQMHESMSGVHDRVVAAVAQVLGMTPAEVTDAMSDGRTLAELAAERAVDAAAVTEAIQQAHRDALNQAVTEGNLTQDQADLMIEHMGSVDHLNGGMMGSMASCHGDAQPAQ